MVSMSTYTQRAERRVQSAVGGDEVAAGSQSDQQCVRPAALSAGEQKPSYTKQISRCFFIAALGARWHLHKSSTLCADFTVTFIHKNYKLLRSQLQ